MPKIIPPTNEALSNCLPVDAVVGCTTGTCVGAPVVAVLVAGVTGSDLVGDITMAVVVILGETDVEELLKGEGGTVVVPLTSETTKNNVYVIIKNNSNKLRTIIKKIIIMRLIGYSRRNRSHNDYHYIKQRYRSLRLKRRFKKIYRGRTENINA